MAIDAVVAGWTMLFLTRTAICIGLVAFAASNAGGGGLATALDRSARDVAETAGRACLGSSDCLRIGASVLAAAGPLSSAAQDGPAADAEVRAPAPAAKPRRRTEASAVHPVLPSPASARTALRTRAFGAVPTPRGQGNSERT